MNILCAGEIFFRFLITPGTKRTRSSQLCHLHTCCRGHLNQKQLYNHIVAQNVKTMIRKCSLLTKKDMHHKDQQQSVFINYIWLTPRARKMNQILYCDWLPKWARLPTVSDKKYFPKSHIINPLLTTFNLFGQDGWILSLFFFVSLWTSTLSWSINMQKKNLVNIQPS